MNIVSKNFIFGVFVVFLTLLVPQTIFAQQKTLNLSANARSAINNLAKDILTEGINPKITDIKSQLDPVDYATVKTIGVLPDNPLYIFKSVSRSLKIFFTFDKNKKVHQILLDGNEKTLESILVLEKATKTNSPVLRNIYVNISAKVLDSVGSDFDYVAKNINALNKDEAFKFAGIYLKHQILLQEEEDRLGESDFLKIESVRVAHLQSLAHIVVSGDPTQLAKVISTQVGLNYKDLAGAAILRDLENSAADLDRVTLMATQNSLLKDIESKLLKLTSKDRLAEITRYASFIHGNPIRQFQAYNQISKSFTSKEINILTSNLKDKAAQNFKRHLERLDNSEIQKQFVQTVFSEYPIDLRLIFYTEIQLRNSQGQLVRLKEVKKILGSQICQNFGQNSDKLAQTRFYTESIKNPDVLDIKIGQFLVESIQNCSSKTDTALQLVTNLEKAINNNFTKEAKTTPISGNILTKLQAEEILKKEGITDIAPQDEQIVAEIVEEEVKQIEDEVTVPETIIREVLAIEEPTQEEIVQKEEQIVEEIIDAAETGKTSPFVEELPEPVQEEIAKEVENLATIVPTPTTIPTLAPTPAPTSIPTTAPSAVPLPTEEPTLIETIESTAPSPTPIEVTTPSL